MSDAYELELLRSRVEALEAQVSDLLRQLDRPPASRGAAPPPAPAAPVSAGRGLDSTPPALGSYFPSSVPLPPPPVQDLALPSEPPLPPLAPPERRAWPGPQVDWDVVTSAERWLPLVGIVLYLFGVAFLYKYDLDLHWAAGRIITGLLLGGVVLVAGLGLQARRRNLSHVLLGGSIASFYITGYAAYQVFPQLNLPYGEAFAFMAAVTALALVLAVWQDSLPLAFIGVSGGLLTPFVLGHPESNLPWVMTYISLVGIGTGAIYLLRGWRSLLWHALNGVWSILLLSAFESIPLVWPSSDTGRWALQAGAVGILLSFWALPVLREVLHARNPQRWPKPAPLPARFEATQNLLDAHVYVLAAVLPFAVLGFSILIWGSALTWANWGWCALGGAALFVGTWGALRRAMPRLAYAHALVAVGLLTLGLLLLWPDHVQLLALAAEASALLLLATRLRDKGLSICGHLLFAGVAGWLAFRLLASGVPNPPLVNPTALADLAVLGLALLVSGILPWREAAVTYRGAFHLALLAWIWREMHGLPNGDSIVMLAWAGYGLGLFLLARRLRNRQDALVTSVAAHVALDGALGILAAQFLIFQPGVLPVWNARALVDLYVMGLAMAASFVVQGERVARIYRLCVHTAVLGWLWRESSAVEQAQGYVMLRWAAYLTTLAFVAYRLRDRWTLRFAHVGYVAVGILFLLRILDLAPGNPPLLNAATLLDGLVLALALATSFVAPPDERTAFRLAVHAGVLALLWRELHSMAFGADFILLAWAAYGVGLLVLGLRTREAATRLTGHVVFGLAGLGLLGKITLGLIEVNQQWPPVLNLTGLSNLALLVLGALAFRRVRDPGVRLVYGGWLYLAFGGWIWQEIGLLPSGNGYVSLAWGALALGLLLAGRRASDRRLLLVGLVTLLAVAAKLFVVDLYYLGTLWPILLFLGFGGLFLLLSYYVQRLSRTRRAPAAAGGEAARGDQPTT